MPKLTWYDAFAVAAICSFSSIGIFLMLNVLASSVIANTVLLWYDETPGLAFFLAIGGLLIAQVVTIIISYFSVDATTRKYAIYAVLLAFASNLALIVALSYYFVYQIFPAGFEDTSPLGLLVAFPKVVTYFAAFFVGNVPEFWLLSQLTYTGFYVVFLKLLNAKKKTKRPPLPYKK
jgi:hypothetical protein